MWKEIHKALFTVSFSVWAFSIALLYKERNVGVQ
jgi:hypothetical protein